MPRLPYTIDVRLKAFTPEIFDTLADSPYCFFLDSAAHEISSGRYSFFGIDPVKTFSSTGGLITINKHTFIDNPVDALRRLEKESLRLPTDPYLPLGGGLVGFVGHSWPDGSEGIPDLSALPDAWFGLYDTILTYDHLEKSCWISSIGLNPDLTPDIDTAKARCERLLALLETKLKEEKVRYIIKPLVPEPASNFTKDAYINAVESAKTSLNRHEWQRTNLARRFHAPVAIDSWSIHKMLCRKNPTPYTSFMRCGSFDLSSTSPSSFLKIKDDHLTCNVVRKSISKSDDPERDELNRRELINRSFSEDPAVTDDETSLKVVLTERPKLVPPEIESDTRLHYLVNRIEGVKVKGSSTVDCLAAAMPGAAMTGVPKAPVNNWLKRTEPAKRNVYTGAMGYIGTCGDAQFSTAVRTMAVKDGVAYVHSGWQITETTDAEEAFYTSKGGVDKLFENIKDLGFK